MDLGICLIARDEREDYLKEWVEYHFSIGADFICIYDNGSRIPISSFIINEKVEVVSWPGNYVQKNAYENFYVRYRGKIRWGAFIDADEFIISKCGNIKKNLEGHTEFGGLALSWLMFGSNGLMDNPSGSQIHAFTKRSHANFGPNAHIKTIAQLSLITGYLTPHHFAYASPYFCANELGHPVYAPTMAVTHQYVYINHYYTRSYNEYMTKLVKGRADAPLGRGAFEIYDKNDIEDLTLSNLWKSR